MPLKFERFDDNNRNAPGRSFFLGALATAVLFLSSCAGPPRLQPEINSLLISNRWSMAADRIEEAKADYGHGNYLLYYLDRGLLEQMTGRYAESIRSFEKAKQRFEKLYTQSISDEAASWAVNDYRLPYRGTDYEYVLVNVFQALNFVQAGQITEALVEARDLDSKFRVIEELARNSKRKHFEDNGFARMFMGLLYEAAGSPQDINDALIAYRQALALYDGYYGNRYVPQVLAERLLALAERFNDDDLFSLRLRFPLAALANGGRPSGKAVVYLVHLMGYSPIKVPEVIPVPLDRGLMTKITFPQFVRRYYATRSSRLDITGSGGQVRADTELGADIEGIAIRDLEEQKARVLAKAILRPSIKYLLERNQKEIVKKHYGNGAAELFGLFSDLYNFYSEEADLRSWQTMPAQIRIARVMLEPGQYHFRLELLGENGGVSGSEDLGEVSLRAGETKFFVRRAAQ